MCVISWYTVVFYEGFKLNNKTSTELRKLCAFERRHLAKRCGISATYLNHLIYLANKRPSPDLALKIEMVSNGRYRKEDMRPDVDWSLVEG